MEARRQFIAGLSAAVTAGALWPERLLAESNAALSDKHGPVLPSRLLGHTGEKVTMLGLGGQHYRRLDGEGPILAIEMSIAGGIRFFDTATSYGDDALSERLFGRYLTPKYRGEIYLMTKSTAKDPKTARLHLENSLRNLKTDVIDLWQVHAITSIADVDERWDSGAVDVFLKAREEGKVRHLGFSGHSHPEVQLHMIKRLTERGIQFEAAQFPVNVCDPAYASFIKEVLPVCLKSGIGVLAMKTMCGGRIFGGIGEGWGPRGKISVGPLIPDSLSFREATDYVWSLPISTRIAGFDDLTQIQQNIDAAKAVGELSPEKLNRILEIAAQQSGPNREYYKRNTLAQNDPREKRF
jgi:aryl-alcohol dehydrogenase-like predicted oxidoreductase